MPRVTVLFVYSRAMANLRLLTFFIIAWIMGIGVGLIFTFLFWHLQDFGGGPTLFGIASVINHMSEMAAYFYSFKIIAKYGHIKVKKKPCCSKNTFSNSFSKSSPSKLLCIQVFERTSILNLS